MGRGEVDQFFQSLKHPLKAEAEKLRAMILECAKAVTEQLKWKAPSFIFGGDDRITFNFSNPKSLRVILHRGAKVKDARNFEFEDKTGLVTWKAKDRGQLEFKKSGEVAKNSKALKKLFAEWLRYSAKMDSEDS